MERGPSHVIREAGRPGQVEFRVHRLNLPMSLQAAVGGPGVQRGHDLLLKCVTPDQRRPGICPTGEGIPQTNGSPCSDRNSHVTVLLVHRRTGFVLCGNSVLSNRFSLKSRPVFLFGHFAGLSGVPISPPLRSARVMVLSHSDHGPLFWLLGKISSENSPKNGQSTRHPVHALLGCIFLFAHHVLIAFLSTIPRICSMAGTGRPACSTRARSSSASCCISSGACETW
jgi:hypothetical protein